MKRQNVVRRPVLESLEKREVLTSFTPIPLTDMTPDVGFRFPAQFSNFSPLGEHLAFNVGSDRVKELWITDGTADGTTELGDASIGLKVGSVDTSASSVVNAHNTSFFNAHSEFGQAVWATDGTLSGTFNLPANTTLVDSGQAHDSTPTITTEAFTLFHVRVDGDLALYRTDGTAEGTFPILQNLESPLEHSEEIDVDEDGFVTFVLGQSLYRTNGTADETHEALRLSTVVEDGNWQLWSTPSDGEAILLASDSNGSVEFQRSVGGVFLFSASKWILGSLWRTDGTAEGTRVLRGTNSRLRRVGNQDGRAWFESIDGVSLDDMYLFSTDGETSSGAMNYGHVGGRGAFLKNGTLLYYEFDRDFPRSLTQINGPLRVGTLAERPSEVSVVGDTTYSVSRGFFDNELDFGFATERPVIQNSIRFLDDAYRGAVGERREKPLNQPLFVIETIAGDNNLFALDGGFLREDIDQVDLRFDWQYTEDGFFYTSERDDLGVEPVFSDGSVHGTSLIDLWPGAGSSDPELVNWQTKTLVVADHPDFGRELWLLEPEPTIDVTVEPAFVVKEFDDLKLSLQNEVPADAVVSWDLDNDGMFDDAFGAAPVVAWNDIVDRPQFDDPQRIRVRVETENLVGLAQSSLLIRNAPPVISDIRMPTQIAPDEEVQFEIIGREIEQVSVRFSDAVEFVTASPTFTRSFDRVGRYELSVSVTDSDGATTRTQTPREILVTWKADLDGDLDVDFGDFLALSQNFGSNASRFEGDIDGNGVVDFSDFLLLASEFGSDQDMLLL